MRCIVEIGSIKKRVRAGKTLEDSLKEFKVSDRWDIEVRMINE